MSSIHLYSASAGSGKTFTLVRSYLGILFREAKKGRYDAFSQVLAITFTVKATEEMKQRIIDTLKKLATGGEEAMLSALREDLPGHDDFASDASRILQHLLHDFGHFQIQTIDSFFQQIIRSFARELNLPMNYEIERDHEEGIDYAVDSVMERIGYDETLTRWLQEFAFFKLDEHRSWNIRDQLKEIAREIFKEDVDITTLEAGTARLQEIRSGLWKSIGIFREEVHRCAEDIRQAMDVSGIEEKHFNHHWRNGIDKLTCWDGILKSLPSSKTFLAQLENPANCFNKPAKDKQPDVVSSLISGSFGMLTTQLHRLYSEQLPSYITNREAVRHLYSVGVLQRIQEYLRRYRTERNILYISDAARLIGGFVQLDDMPFLFEKVGAHLRYVFIDEFQDTSTLHWNNILPILHNILGLSHGGLTVLIVGDAKQSIYRWRGGDSRLLTRGAEEMLTPFETVHRHLDTNRRSLSEVIEFNNRFFETAVKLPAVAVEPMLHHELEEMYRYAAQKTLPDRTGGLVRLEIIAHQKGDDWREEARHQLLKQISEVRKQGYRLHELAILTRRKSEGVEISHFLQENGLAVLSQETLLLRFNDDVRLLTAALRFIDEPETPFHYVNLLWQYCQCRQIEVGTHDLFTDSTERNLMKTVLPEFLQEAPALRSLPFYRTLERLFVLLNVDRAALYPAHFRQLALDFFRRESGSTGDFLQWWEREKERASVQLEDGNDRIRILTMHKAKGLEFPVVFLPYGDWDISRKMYNDMNWLSDNRVADGMYLPYQFRSEMADSLFAEAYREEKSRLWIDTLNLLYVAFTRAEKALFVSCPYADPTDKLPSNASGIVRAVAERMGFEGIGRHNWGALPVSEDQSETKPAPEAVQDPESADGRIHLSLKDAFDSPKTRIGNLVHKALYYLGRNAPDTAFRKAASELPGTAEDIAAARTHFNNLCANAEMSRWLDPDIPSWDEQDLWLDGQLLRPDRIVRNDGGFAVLDYKTGEPNPGYANTVRAYMRAVQEVFGHLPVKGYIIYTESAKVEEVA